MRSDWMRRLVVGLSVLTAGNLIGRSGIRADDKPKEDQGPNNRAIEGRVPDALITDRAMLHGEPVNAEHRYWIGVMCEPANETLHTQLPDLPKGNGLVVQQVMADSPAAKAGLKPNDILFAVGDKPLGQVSDLSSVIEAGKGTELSLKLLRGGKATTIAIKPEEQKPLGEHLNAATGKDTGALRLFVNTLQSADLDGQLGLNGIRVAPDALRPWTVSMKHELPDDLSVNIFREGKKPAKITVKKGNQKWEVNEDELGKLPEDVRREIEPLVGVGGPLRIRLDMSQDAALNSLRVAPLNLSLADVSVNGNDADIVGRLEKNVEEIDQRLAQMKQTIKELRAARDHAAEKPSKDK